MSFYTGLAATAGRLLKDKGQQATWVHDNKDGVFDPALGVITGGTTKTYKAFGALFDFDTSRIDGTSIITDDKKFLMEAGNVPLIGAQIAINNKTYSVLAVRETSPAGTVVMYELQLRT